MTFEQALAEIRAGERVRRTGWTDGVSAVRCAVHLESRDLLADDWELFQDPEDLAASWERAADAPDDYHPAAAAAFRRCARELRAQAPHPVIDELPSLSEMRGWLKNHIALSIHHGRSSRAALLTRVRDSLAHAGERG